ncbi:MAG: calcium-binding protein, partial [Magnetococcales bacterium]|nr:calcium-binding protein [Magnetococcales bacterium]
GLGNDTYMVDNLLDQVVETSTLAGEKDMVQSSVSWTLGDNLENLTLLGKENLNGTGNNLANTLLGNTGANQLDGKGGSDILKGGKGDDTYILDLISSGSVKLADTLTENAHEGNDTVQIRVDEQFTLATSYTLNMLNNVENMTVAGSGTLAFNLTGSTGNNLLEGNQGNNILDGGKGKDTLVGGEGNDSYLVDEEGELPLLVENQASGNDTLKILFNNISTVTAKTISLQGTLANLENMVVAGNGLFNLLGNGASNTLTGNDANNRLEGGEGADSLVGGAGKDTLVGGAGDDWYEVDNAGDVLVEEDGNGVDTVQVNLTTGTYTLASEFENATLLGTFTTHLTGNSGNNLLTGNSAANILDGGAGADILVGGLGGDTYLVDDVLDQVVESSSLVTEMDTVQSFVDWTLGSNLENLTLLGKNSLQATGNGLANLLTGNSGANRLDGAGGVDTLRGGAGDDFYVVDLIRSGTTIRLQDTLVENAHEGSDTLSLRTADTFTLPTPWTLQLATQFENATVADTGSLAIHLTGNTANNRLTGNNGNNILNGGGGADTLVGGGGADQFRIDRPAALTLEDFNGLEGDTISLAKASYAALFKDGQLKSGILATSTDNSFANFVSAQLLYNTLTGGLWYDRDFYGGNSAAVQIATFNNKAALEQTYFTLVG